MRDWKAFWTDHPATIAETEFLVQVGHTINGRPYSDELFRSMIGSIVHTLDLNADDFLLDLCCGNGIVTCELASICRKVVGVDFSPTLIARAKQHHASANISYIVYDALDIGSLELTPAKPFTKFSMYAALQHFQKEDLLRLISGLLRHAAGSAVIMIGGILDQRRISAFFDTEEKRLAYEQYKRDGKDRLGTWWQPEEIASAAFQCGLACTTDDSSPGRPGGHYRFDACLFR